MANCYASLADFGRFTNNMPLDAGDAVAVLFCLEEASRFLDDYCNRQFYVSQEARVFDGTGRDPNNTDYLNWATRSFFTASMSFLRIPDCLSLSAAALDQDSDRVFETALNPAKDYYLLNEGGRNQDAPPFDKFQLDIFNGAITVLSSRPRLVQLTGAWGYSDSRSADTITGTVADATTSTLSASGAGSLAQGQTIILDSEQLYISGGNATHWTVLRGVNGTTPAAHTGATVYHQVYPAKVREKTLLQAARFWERRKSAYQQIVTMPGGATMAVQTGLDPDLKSGLTQLIRMVI